MDQEQFRDNLKVLRAEFLIPSEAAEATAALFEMMLAEIERLTIEVRQLRSDAEQNTYLSQISRG